MPLIPDFPGKMRNNCPKTYWSIYPKDLNATPGQQPEGPELENECRERVARRQKANTRENKLSELTLSSPEPAKASESFSRTVVNVEMQAEQCAR
jgi:hypothetical protein